MFRRGGVRCAYFVANVLVWLLAMGSCAAAPLVGAIFSPTAVGCAAA